MSQQRHGSTPGNAGAVPAFPDLPEATIARLPEYLRALHNLAENGSDTISSSPWLFYFPAGALTLLTVSMALISDGLRDAFDPRQNRNGD